MTKEEKNTKKREYERSFSYYLRRRHYEMSRRVKGKLSGDRKTCPWFGLECLSKAEYDKWSQESINLAAYSLLHIAWKQAGFPRYLAPSVDRIDSTIGYIPSNMIWVTHQENSRRALAKGKETQAKKRAG